MESRWNEVEARACAASVDPSELGLRVYTSRLLGSEPALVLHGGGNTSFKREAEDLLYVKGSGSDLARVEPRDFAVVHLNAVRALINAADLDNAALAQAVARVVHQPGPKPSIETLLHAVLPFRFVEHTHADSILAVTNTANGERLARELFGELAPLVPFRHSGFALAQAAHDVFHRSATRETIGLVLLHHGVFAFGDTAQASYENMLRLVTRAEAFLQARNAWRLPEDPQPFVAPDPVEIARLRARMSHQAGFPLLLRRLDGPQWQAYARRADLAALAAEGPATPQHAVFIKREPLLGTDVDGYARRYAAYVAAGRNGATPAQCGLDPAPRAVIDAQLGVWAASIDEHYLRMTTDILRQDMEIKTRAAALDRYAGLPADAILEAEIHYGGFERRMHAAASPASEFLGEVVVLGDAAPEAARAAFAARGATVVTLPGAGDDALRDLCLRYGGVDVAVLDGSEAGWANALLPVLACAPRGGRVVLLVPAADANPQPLADACRELSVDLVVAHLGPAATQQAIEQVVSRCRRSPAALPAGSHTEGATQ